MCYMETNDKNDLQLRQVYKTDETIPTINEWKMKRYSDGTNLAPNKPKAANMAV